MITILFPDTITLVSGTCSLSSVTSPMSTSASCSVSNNLLTITNPFGSSGSYTAGGAALSFIFNTGGTNPSVVKDAGKFVVTVSQVEGGQSYPVDSSTYLKDIFIPEPALLSAVVTPSSLMAYGSPVTYSMAITPSASIPKSSYITIKFPSQVSLSGINIPSCSFTIGGVTT